MKFDTVVNGRPGRLTIESSRLRYEVEGAAPLEREFSCEPVQSGIYSVLIGGRSYEVVPDPVPGGGTGIRVNGLAIAVEVYDPRSLRGRKVAGAALGRQSVTAPMPGKVVRILVAAGDVVQAGQGLIVVEAMKMQNEMKSPKAGRVAEIRTKAGAAVSAGEVLTVIE